MTSKKFAPLMRVAAAKLKLEEARLASLMAELQRKDAGRAAAERRIAALLESKEIGSTANAERIYRTAKAAIRSLEEEKSGLADERARQAGKVRTAMKKKLVLEKSTVGKKA
jgi:hypothetical protein